MGYAIEHCAACHGEDAAGKTQGRHVRPNLPDDRMKQATPGELFWLLTNGSEKWHAFLESSP